MNEAVPRSCLICTRNRYKPRCASSSGSFHDDNAHVGRFVRLQLHQVAILRTLFQSESVLVNFRVKRLVGLRNNVVGRILQNEASVGFRLHGLKIGRIKQTHSRCRCTCVSLRLNQLELVSIEGEAGTTHVEQYRIRRTKRD